MNQEQIKNLRTETIHFLMNGMEDGSDLPQVETSRTSYGWDLYVADRQHILSVPHIGDPPNYGRDWAYWLAAMGPKVLGIVAELAAAMKVVEAAKTRQATTMETAHMGDVANAIDALDAALEEFEAKWGESRCVYPHRDRG